MALEAVAINDLSEDVFADIRRTGAKALQDTGCVLVSNDMYDLMMEALADYTIEREAARRIANGCETVSEKDAMKMLGITEDDLKAAGDVDIE